jgi:hypothetical protein
VFTFTTHPAAVTVTDGVGIAFGYLQKSWRTWLPAVVVVAICSFAAYTLVGQIPSSDLYTIDSSTGQVVVDQAALGKYIGTLFETVGILAIVQLIAGWVFNACAIAGLRDRPLTASYVVGRGLMTLAASILIGLLFGCAALALILVTVVVLPIGILLDLAAIPLAIYVGVRLSFTSLAIFDGFGPIGGIQESWALSERSVLRVFGWGLMIVLISIGFGIVGSFFSVPLATGRLAPVGEAASSAISTTATCLTTFMIAVLYESQRSRRDPTLYEFAPGPGYPGPGYPGYPGPGGSYPAWPPTPPPGQYPQPPYPGGPYQPGGPYPGAPYPGAPYPGGPYQPGAGGPYPGGPYPGAPYPGGPYPGGPYQPGMPPPGWPGHSNVPPAWGSQPPVPPAGPAGQPAEPAVQPPASEPPASEPHASESPTSEPPASEPPAS